MTAAPKRVPAIPAEGCGTRGVRVVFRNNVVVMDRPRKRADVKTKEPKAERVLRQQEHGADGVRVVSLMNVRVLGIQSVRAAVITRERKSVRVTRLRVNGVNGAAAALAKPAVAMKAVNLTQAGAAVVIMRERKHALRRAILRRGPG